MFLMNNIVRVIIISDSNSYCTREIWVDCVFVNVCFLIVSVNRKDFWQIFIVWAYYEFRVFSFCLFTFIVYISRSCNKRLSPSHHICAYHKQEEKFNTGRVCVCVYIYLNEHQTLILLYMGVCKGEWEYTYVLTNLCWPIYIYIWEFYFVILVCLWALRLQLQKRPHAHTYVHIYTYMHIYMHTYIHICTHICAYLHMYFLTYWRSALTPICRYIVLVTMWVCAGMRIHTPLCIYIYIYILYALKRMYACIYACVCWV